MSACVQGQANNNKMSVNIIKTMNISAVFNRYNHVSKLNNIVVKLYFNQKAKI